MINDVFSIGIEIDLEKSGYDANGDYIVEGIATSGKEDFQGETIDPKGWDLSYFLRKGFMKWEHSKNPRNFIGEPLEARMTNDGLYVKGRLYGGMAATQEAVELMDGLKKSKSSRRIGMSIEGAALERDPYNPNKVTKAVLRNVALTANPVNDATWADLVKSLSSASALTVELDETEMLLKQVLSRGNEGAQLQKALGTDTPGGTVLQPQSLEKDEPADDEDPKKRRQAVVNAFRKFIHSYLQKTALQKSLNDAPRVGATSFAIGQGLEEDEVEDFASLIDNNHTLLKSLAARVAGGEISMSKVTDDLQKSLESLAGLGAEEEKEETNAAEQSETSLFDEVNKDLIDEEDEPEFEPDDENSEEADKELGGDEDGDGDADDEDSELVKSLTAEDPEIEEAFEVTGFLRAIANHMGRSVDGLSVQLEKSLGTQGTLNNELVKSLGAIGRVVMDVSNRAETAEQENADLRGNVATMTDLIKSLSEKVDVLMNVPVGRRGVTNARELQLLQKSQGAEEGQPQPSREDVTDLLVKGFMANECDRMDVTRFETGGLRSVSARGRNYISRQLSRIGN